MKIALYATRSTVSTITRPQCNWCNHIAEYFVIEVYNKDWASNWLCLDCYKVFKSTVQMVNSGSIADDGRYVYEQ